MHGQHSNHVGRAYGRYVMYKTLLLDQLKFDARMPSRDVKLTAGEVPMQGDPRLAAYLEMQSETRSLLGLLLWVSLAYPQISHQVNTGCGFMANPPHDVNAYAKHIATTHLPVPGVSDVGGARTTWSLARQLSIRSLMGQKNTAYTLLQMHRQTMQHVASQVGLECLLAVQ